MVLGGFLCFIWDFGGRKLLFNLKTRVTRTFVTPVRSNRSPSSREDIELSAVGLDTRLDAESELNERRLPAQPTETDTIQAIEPAIQSSSPTDEVQLPPRQMSTSPITLRTGVLLIVGFLVSFVAIMVVRSVLHNLPVAFKLFSNMYLAGNSLRYIYYATYDYVVGTIIFGGGPVVIPLLREYIVTEGWVSTRDFLIGLAVIQAFPGPNFNCTLCRISQPTLIFASRCLPRCIDLIICKLSRGADSSLGFHRDLLSR